MNMRLALLLVAFAALFAFSFAQGVCPIDCGNALVDDSNKVTDCINDAGSNIPATCACYKAYISALKADIDGPCAPAPCAQYGLEDALKQRESSVSQVCLAKGITLSFCP